MNNIIGRIEEIVAEQKCLLKRYTTEKIFFIVSIISVAMVFALMPMMSEVAFAAKSYCLALPEMDRG